MIKLGILCASLGAAVVMVSSCGSSDATKQDADAGAGGMESGEGGEPPQPSAGSSNQPQGGQGGAPAVIEAGAAGEPPVGGTGQGGAGGAAELGGAGGAGGAPDVLVCPAEPGAFDYSCGEIRDLWSPTYDTATRTFHLDLGDLPFDVQSGTIQFFYYTGNGNSYCSGGAVIASGSQVSHAINSVITDITRVRIYSFTLTDVCGNTHTYDPIGAPQCNDLEATGNTGTLNLSCVIRLGPCPDSCA